MTDKYMRVIVDRLRAVVSTIESVSLTLRRIADASHARGHYTISGTFHELAQLLDVEVGQLARIRRHLARSEPDEETSKGDPE
jgi:hypothetical protein